MQASSFDAVPTLDGTPFGPSRMCQGVDFVTTACGGQIPCTVTAAVLQRDYGAARDVLSSWLGAFVRHRQHIDERIVAALAGREDVDRVLFNTSPVSPGSSCARLRRPA